MKENINDIIRNKISKKFYSKNSEEFDQKIDEFFCEVMNNKKDNKMDISVIYLTSFMINYLTYSRFKEDDEAKMNMSRLLDFSSLDDFINKLDKETLKMMIKDVIYFNNFCYFIKKKYVLKSLEKSKKIIKLAPTYFMDVLSYNKNFTVKDIIREYNRSYKDCFNHNVALEDAICYAVDNILDLYDNNIDNYKSIMIDIINTYYMYNRYLLLSDSKMDENAIDIMDFLEYDTPGSILYASSDSEFLESVIRDYLFYELLDDKNKNEIINYLKSCKRKEVINNPNDKIRDMLKNNFKNINIYDEEEVKDNIDIITKLKESSYFDFIVSVLYTDSMYLSYYDYFSFPNNFDIKTNYEYIKNMKSIDEFKKDLLENDMVLLDAIDKSTVFSDFTLLTKKEVLLTLENDDVFASFITDNYIFDKLSSARRYDLEDAKMIYREKLLSIKDKKLAVAHSTSELLADLRTLRDICIDNYKEILYDLTEIYYEYNKYMFDNENDIDIEDRHILKYIDNDLNTFLAQIEGNEKVLEKLSNSFYKYISLANLDKDKIKHYYDNLCKNGKVKVFNKKKRGSNT
ncbi:MAG: hypothetical protein ACLUD7_02145 [Lachnospiraceae bacterium]